LLSLSLLQLVKNIVAAMVAKASLSCFDFIIFNLVNMKWGICVVYSVKC
jgi:hypothetical protein